MSRRDRLETPANPPFPWRIFWVLLGGSVLGYVGALPYAFDVLPKLRDLRQLPMPVPVFILTQVLQAMIIFGLVIVVGLLLAPRVGLRMPLLRGWLYGATDADLGRIAWFSIIVGLVAGAVSVVLFYGFFIRYLPGWPSEATVPIWKRVLACVYGGFNEELFLRLFLMVLLLAFVRKITRSDIKPGGTPFWIVNLLVALLFGFAHVPIAATMMTLTPAVIAIVTGFIGGTAVLFGYVAWTRGLEAALLAHLFCDLVIHLVGPLFSPA